MYDYMLIGAFGVIGITLVVYIYIKDNEVSKKFFLYEKAIEDINKKLFELEKKLSIKSDGELEKRLKIYIDEIIEESVEKISEYLIAEKNEQTKDMHQIKQEIYNKIEQMEDRIRGFNMLPDDYQSNEKKIISLYNKGLSVSEIARNLRIGIGEVELVLKIEGIK